MQGNFTARINLPKSASKLKLDPLHFLFPCTATRASNSNHNINQFLAPDFYDTPSRIYKHHAGKLLGAQKLAQKAYIYASHAHYIMGKQHSDASSFASRAGFERQAGFEMMSKAIMHM